MDVGKRSCLDVLIPKSAFRSYLLTRLASLTSSTLGSRQTLQKKTKWGHEYELELKKEKLNKGNGTGGL